MSENFRRFSNVTYVNLTPLGNCPNAVATKPYIRNSNMIVKILHFSEWKSNPQPCPSVNFIKNYVQHFTTFSNIRMKSLFNFIIFI